MSFRLNYIVILHVSYIYLGNKYGLINKNKNGKYIAHI